MAEEQKPDESRASHKSLGQQTRPRQSLDRIDRLDSRSAPGLGGIQNSGPSFITEHIGKILAVIAFIAVLAYIGLQIENLV